MNCATLFRRLLSLAVLVSFCGLAFADSHARIVRLSFVEGTVQMQRGHGEGLQPAFLNMPVTEGSKIVTDEDGRAEIQFEEGSAIRLVPNSTIEFPQMGLRSSGAKYTAATLNDGQAYFDVHHRRDDEFAVEVGNQTVSLNHSAEFRADVDHGKINIAVIHGEVRVSGGQENATVHKGETYSLDLEEAKNTVAKGVASGPYDDWNSERNDYDEYSYANPAPSAIPYYYGLNDLQYYGNFVAVPGWGMMWQPNFMNAGWNPYMDGGWAYYPGFGYTWVSGYPWGWLPYHYGAWEFVPGWGWMWQPGTEWMTWVPVAPVRNPPPSFRPPQPPSQPPSHREGGIVAVGRGPAEFSPRLRQPEVPAIANGRTKINLIEPPRVTALDRSHADEPSIRSEPSTVGPSPVTTIPAQRPEPVRIAPSESTGGVRSSPPPQRIAPSPRPSRPPR